MGLAGQIRIGFQAPAPEPLISDDAARRFDREAGGGYTLALPDLGIAFKVDRLRRERHELHAELAVECDLAAARTVGGTLSVADFNLSSLTARKTMAKYLAERSRADDVDSRSSR